MEMDNLYLGTVVPKYGTGVGYDYRQATRKSEERVEGSLHFNNAIQVTERRHHQLATVLRTCTDIKDNGTEMGNTKAVLYVRKTHDASLKSGPQKLRAT